MRVPLYSYYFTIASYLCSCDKKFNSAKLYLLNTNYVPTRCQHLMVRLFSILKQNRPFLIRKRRNENHLPHLKVPWPPLILDDSSFLQHVSIILTSGLFIFHVVSSATFTLWTEKLTSYVCVIKGSQEYWIS